MPIVCSISFCFWVSLLTKWKVHIDQIGEDRILKMMELPETLPEEIEQVRNILTREGLWKTFHGYEYGVWEVKVTNFLTLQNLWHFIVEEDPRAPYSFKALIEFQKERRQVVSLCLI